MARTLSPPQATRRGLNSMGRGISHFPRRDPASSWRTMSFTVVYTVAPSAGRNDQSSFYSMAILPLAIIRSFICLPAGSIVQGLMWPHLSPHTNLSAVRGEPLTRIVWSSRRLCRRTSPRFARSLAGSLMKVAHPWGFRVFRLGDGLRD